MTLTQEIRQYYLKNLNLLNIDKRFHFASRLAAWEDSAEATTILKGLKNYILNNDVRVVLKNILDSQAGNVYGKDLRKEYFEKYPNLFGIHNALFRLRHLKEIYGIDAREELLNLVSQNELELLYTKLINDTAALRILSRFAIDYIFLYEILFGAKKRLDPALILRQKDRYKLSDSTQLHLFIYLFTHCIIADSNFYIRNVPKNRLSIFNKFKFLR